MIRKQRKINAKFAHNTDRCTNGARRSLRHDEEVENEANNAENRRIEHCSLTTHTTASPVPTNAHLPQRNKTTTTKLQLQQQQQQQPQQLQLLLLLLQMYSIGFYMADALPITKSRASKSRRVKSTYT